jgi:hypothetical protein
VAVTCLCSCGRERTAARLSCTVARAWKQFVVATWWCCSGCMRPNVLRMMLCTEAAGGGLEVLMWLRARGCPWCEDTCAGVAEGHIAVLARAPVGGWWIR